MEPDSNSPAQVGPGADRDCIKVAVRLRPLLEDEIAKGVTPASWHTSGQSISLPMVEWRRASQRNSVRTPEANPTPPCSVRKHERNTKYQVEADHVFTNESTEQVYAAVFKDTVSNLKSGLNGALLAYGQTGSGKTYSMFGSRINGRRTRGILHFAADDIFAFIEADPSREYLVRMSYLEVYNERVNDLLRPFSPDSRNLPVREDTKGSPGEFYVEGLKEKIVRSSAEIISALERAEDRRRAVASSQFNEISSRSHGMCFIKVESSKGASGAEEEVVEEELTRVGVLCLVDLAGSERSDDITNRLETCSINKSLFFLRETINKLSSWSLEKATVPTSPAPHISWRDSRLTQLLVPFLSPSAGARSAILVTLHPGSQRSVIEHSVSSLRFATRAATVAVSAEPMVHYVSAEHSMIAKQREMINVLRAQIEQLRSASPDKKTESPSSGVNYVSDSRDLDNIVLRLHQAASNLKRRQGALVGTAEHLLERMDQEGDDTQEEEFSHDEGSPCVVCNTRRRLLTVVRRKSQQSAPRRGPRGPLRGDDVSQLLSDIDFQDRRQNDSPSETTADVSDDSGVATAVSETSPHTPERVAVNSRVEVTILRQQLRQAKNEAAEAKKEIQRLQDQANAEALLMESSSLAAPQSSPREYFTNYGAIRMPVMRLGGMLPTNSP
ncbi:Bipolar kinesin KRP-130, putative [Perkinsus marinus ATCC 50983]|uniref:Kinesin-like protein n=1 Tax=Perkinsus marinus (strain ATCC 50983 / TXsc) TaxID=423536 RepID=C5KWK9_PERM5|nr:Bipolar kinesin KRP-130, putative [Perkinsus marinus ATCC 50983]EER11084.1 Bipolar kinesin KRP-130, putative [Perkinsus marinus ATCC 50983]|eukprot:XP_002779289.1 Bipolar kinesin KRP-130, putative [Perkinsus marinus ATCC 50983]